MIFSETINQYIYQFIEHGFKNNLKKEVIHNLLSIYENNEELEEEDIEGMCLVSAKDSDNRQSQSNEQLTNNEEYIKISTNINDFDVEKVDKTKKNLMVFNDCSSNKDQDVQTKFFQNGRHFKCACIYLTHRSHQSELKPLRGNTAVFVLFEQPVKVLEQITRDINLGMENQEFDQLARNAWAIPSQKKYLFINLQLEGD